MKWFRNPIEHPGELLWTFGFVMLILTGWAMSSIIPSPPIPPDTFQKEFQETIELVGEEAVEKGIISGEEAQELYQKEFEKRMKPFIEKEQKEFEKLSLDIQESAMWPRFIKREVPTIIALGIPIAVVSYAVPIVGVGVAGAFGLGAVTMEEKQYRQMAKYPVIFLWSMIFTFIGIIGLFVSPFHFFHKKKDK